MNLTPLDVRKATFRKVIRGWDPEEVLAFLEVVAENYEHALQDNAKLTERVQGLEERIAQYQGMERLLQDSMLTAERLAADARDSSRRESEQRIEEAQKRAERILEDSRERLRNLNREIAELVQRKDLYVQKFRSLVQSQQMYLDEHQQDMAEIDEIGQDVVDLLVNDAGNLDASSELESDSEAAHPAPAGGSGEPQRDPFADMGATAGHAGELLVQPSEAAIDEPRVHPELAEVPELDEVSAQEEPAPEPLFSEAEEEPAVAEGEAGREPVETAKGFFPPRVRRQGFFDLKADGNGDSN